MPEIKKSGYERWWPMKQHIGRNSDGTKITAEVYRNMLTGEIHHPKDKEGIANGWNGDPPPIDSAEKVFVTANEVYRKNYDQIDWK
jgi:hypothetical protein